MMIAENTVREETTWDFFGVSINRNDIKQPEKIDDTDVYKLSKGHIRFKGEAIVNLISGIAAEDLYIGAYVYLSATPGKGTVVEPKAPDTVPKILGFIADPTTYTSTGKVRVLIEKHMSVSIK